MSARAVVMNDVAPYPQFIGDHLQADKTEYRPRVLNLALEHCPSCGYMPSNGGGWPKPLDLEALAEREPEAPEFIVADWLPVGYATLLAGHGGVGKSGIALHLAACIAAGQPFFGVPVERRRVLYLSCEDREGVLHWRLARICEYTGLDMARLRGWLEIIDLVGQETVLWERDPKTGYAVTPAYEQLASLMGLLKTEVLVIDGVNDTYGGQGGSTTDVKRYVNTLVRLIPADRGAVLLIGHIDKKSAREGAGGEGYLGPTSWHNSVRARWYLSAELTEVDESGRTERTGDLVLELQKSNLGRTGRSMRFRWNYDAHFFVGEMVGESAFDRKHQDRTEQVAILRALHGCTVAGVTVPAAMQGPRTAHLVLSARAEFPESLKGAGAAKKRRFRRQIEELRQLTLIEESEYQRSRGHYAFCFKPTAEGIRQCANP